MCKLSERSLLFFPFSLPVTNQVNKKSGQLTSMEHELDEKAGSLADHVTRISQLEQDLSDKTAELTRTQSEVTENQREAERVADSFNKVKVLHSAQCDELQQQLQMVRAGTL